MIHATEGALQAFLDDELPLADRTELERHLGNCGVCAAEVETLRTASLEFSEAIRIFDHPAPLEDAGRAFRRHQDRSGWNREVNRALRRAAVLVLGVAGVASATIPGSPVRGWTAALWDRITPEPESAAIRPAAAPGARGEVARSPAGVSILPVDGRVQVLLESPAPALRVRVRLSDQERAEVQAMGEAAGARFRIAPGRIEVIGAGAGELQIDLPRGVGSATIEVDGKPYLVRDGEQLRILAPAADSAGAEVVFRVGPSD